MMDKSEKVFTANTGEVMGGNASWALQLVLCHLLCDNNRRVI